MADKIYLPKQKTRRGVAGYRDPDHRIVVVDENGPTRPEPTTDKKRGEK